jgi:phosphohistidine phosphatase
MRRLAQWFPAVLPGASGGLTPRRVPRLFLMRHGEAAPLAAGSGDRDRPLSPAGKSRSAEVGRVLAARGETIDRIFCSPAQRTRQTLQALRAGVAGLPRAVFDEALYDAEADYIAFLRLHGGHAEGVLLIGHNPAAYAAALELTGAGRSPAAARLAAGFPPGGLAVLAAELRWRDLAPGRMRLLAFLANGPG